MELILDLPRARQCFLHCVAAHTQTVGQGPGNNVKQAQTSKTDRQTDKELRRLRSRPDKKTHKEIQWIQIIMRTLSAVAIGLTTFACVNAFAPSPLASHISTPSLRRFDAISSQRPSHTRSERFALKVRWRFSRLSRCS